MISQKPIKDKNRKVKAAYHRLTTHTAIMNQHQLKDEINKTRREAFEYHSDYTTEKEPIRKAFLEKKVKELLAKYELLTNKQLDLSK